MRTACSSEPASTQPCSDDACALLAQVSLYKSSERVQTNAFAACRSYKQAPEAGAQQQQFVIATHNGVASSTRGAAHVPACRSLCHSMHSSMPFQVSWDWTQQQSSKVVQVGRQWAAGSMHITAMGNATKGKHPHLDKEGSPHLETEFMNEGSVPTDPSEDSNCDSRMPLLL
eukprot:scaffold10250_cov21-Tisochrysis_lutea.AAC.3